MNATIKEFANGDRRYDFEDGTVVAYKAFDGHYYTLHQPGASLLASVTEGAETRKEVTGMGITKHGSGEILTDPPQQPEPRRDEQPEQEQAQDRERR